MLLQNIPPSECTTTSQPHIFVHLCEATICTFMWSYYLYIYVKLLFVHLCEAPESNNIDSGTIQINCSIIIIISQITVSHQRHPYFWFWWCLSCYWCRPPERTSWIPQRMQMHRSNIDPPQRHQSVQNDNDCHMCNYINFIDFEKAFDSIHGESLWQILRSYSILIETVNIIKNF